jgi:hypothetical protein
MTQNKIPLREIERSIAINCAIDYKSNKPLQLTKWQGLTNQGLGRCIFLYIAKRQGYNKEEICDYLTMNIQEFEQKAAILQELHDNGKMLFETIGHTATYLETRDACLFFYRKLVLAQNYLRYRFGL